MARSHRSHYLERSSGQRNDDDVRAMTRAVALGARAIFGELRCGTVAVVISVALRISINGKTGLRQGAADSGEGYNIHCTARRYLRTINGL
jgi:hypothetical protein